MAFSLRVILIETEYEINLGSVARLMANFSQSPLYLVRPKCEVGFTAKMHSKHAAHILEDAVVCKTLSEATKGCKMVVGTSGVARRHKKLLRNPIVPEELVERLEKGKFSGTLGVLFGREGIGLMGDELAACDTLITIPTSGDYPVMNLSHAVAVVLYALTSRGKRLDKTAGMADSGEYAALMKTFDMLVERQEPYLKNLAKSRLAFRTVIGRAVPNETETRCMLGVLRRTLTEVEGKNEKGEKGKKK